MKEVVEKLIIKNKTISTMESCTGGALVNEITNIEGSSKVISYSAITYSNEFKIKMGVNEETILKYSVYSMEVADLMSKKISEFANSNYGVGITGKLNRIDENNPYGDNSRVFISIYDKDNNKFYNKTVQVEKKTRKECKEQIVKNVIKILNEII